MALSRRDYLKSLTAAALASKASAAPPSHERRIQWWREAKFGMFVHWGLYSILARDGWAMGDEDIPLAEYEPLAKQFRAR